MAACGSWEEPEAVAACGSWEDPEALDAGGVCGRREEAESARCGPRGGRGWGTEGGWYSCDILCLQREASGGESVEEGVGEGSGG